LSSRITLSFAGIPSGKSKPRRASRFTRPLGDEEERDVAFDGSAEPRLDGRLDAPATPCARLRCAPSDAARVKVFPHSGQTSAPEEAAADLLAEAAVVFVVLAL
jgi:hypothetical protein